MYECESWTIKKAEHRKIDAFQSWCWKRLLRVPWTARRSNPVNPKRNQPWIFIRRTDAETPILWPPDGKSWLTGKDWGQEEKGATEDELVGWHHQLDGHEFEQNLGDSEGQGSLACYSSRGYKVLEETWWLNKNNPYHSLVSGQITGREHSPIHQQKTGLKIYWPRPCPPKQDSVFSTAS